MVDEDFVEDFEEEEVILAHVDADEGWEIDIDTLVDRVALFVRWFSHFLFVRY